MKSNLSTTLLKNSARKMIDKFIDKHNKTATIISAILGCTLLAFYSRRSFGTSGTCDGHWQPLGRFRVGGDRNLLSGRKSSVWVEHPLWERAAVGSNPIVPIASLFTGILTTYFKYFIIDR